MSPMPEKTGQKRKRRQTQQSVQRKGTVAAVAVGAAFVGVIGWYVLRGDGRKTDEGAAPDIASVRPRVPVDTSPGAPPQVVRSERLHADMMDKKNPRRKAGTLSYLGMDPLEEHRFAVQEPEAWLYLVTGRSVHIRADSGDLYIPDMQKEPEAGTIKGNVLIEMFEAKPDGKKPVLGVDPPIATMKTQTLTFDSTLNTASTDDPFVVESETATLKANTLRMAFNQVHQRLERLSMKEGQLAVRQGAKKMAAPKPPVEERPLAAASAGGAPVGGGTGATGATGGRAAMGKVATGKPKLKADLETLYHGIFEGNVVALQAGREVDSDELHLWARLIDNKLPEDAFAKLKSKSETRGASAAGATGGGAAGAELKRAGDVARIVPTPAPAPATGAGGARTASAAGAPDDANTLTLFWSGTCTVEPMEETPEELKAEQVALRFVSPKAGEVRFADQGQDGRGHAVSIEYGATDGRLVLAGKDGGAAAYSLGNGQGIEAARIEADLVHGLIHIPVPGVLNDQEGRESRITWGSQADFTLEVRDGAVTRLLKQATFDGGFSATQRDGSLSGGFARADFVAIDEQRFALSRLIVQDHAVGESDKTKSGGTGGRDEGGRLAADTLDIGFVTGPNERAAVPRTVTASGSASASNGTSRLASDRIEAQLEQGEGRKIEVSAASASGNVRFEDVAQDVTAEAEEMRADFGRDAALHGRRRIVDLTGPNVRLRKRVEKREEKSDNWITGTQVRLDDNAKSLAVFGPGALDQVQQGVSEVHAAWTGGMTYNGSEGLAECFGDATARAIDYPDKPGEPTRRDSIEASRLKLELVPDADRKSEGAAGAPQRLKRAIAMGSVLEREGGTNARVTSEKVVFDSQSPGDERRVELEYVEGPTIIADQVAQTLDVPAAGRLVVVDRRDEKRKAVASAPGVPGPGSGDARGDSLFDWDGSMHMDKQVGLMEMHRNVRMTQRALSDGRVTNLTSERLSARATPRQTGGGVALRSVTATGAVYATMGPEAVAGLERPVRQELVADKADYDADTKVITATAERSGRVTFFDPSRGTPLSANALKWDLGTGGIEVIRPGSVVGPR